MILKNNTVRCVLATVVAALSSLAPSAHAAVSNADSIAVIIGNQNYQPLTHDVVYAHNDAEAMRKFLTRKLGYRKENIIFLKDATLGQFIQVFGDERDPKGKLWNWVRPGRSSVFVYYSGHGAPTIDKETYLIPTDIDPERAGRGYSLRTLQRNLSLLKERLGTDRSVMLMLEACFSGQSAGGNLMSISAGIRPKLPRVNAGIIRLSAAASTQVANWDHDRKQGLFTAQFLDAINGKADSGAAGNNDGTVTWDEMTAYLSEEVLYRSSRTYGRPQQPEFSGSAGSEWRFEARENAAERTARLCQSERSRLAALRQYPDIAELRASLGTFECPAVRQQLRDVIALLESEQVSNDNAGIKPDEGEPKSGETDVALLNPSGSDAQVLQLVSDFIEFNWLMERAEFTERVVYFDKGEISRAEAKADQRAYSERWPFRKFRMIPGSLRLEQRKGEAISATFGYTYEVRRKGKRAAGTARSMIVLQRAGNGFLVAGVREAVN